MSSQSCPPNGASDDYNGVNGLQLSKLFCAAAPKTVESSRARLRPEGHPGMLNLSGVGRRLRIPIRHVVRASNSSTIKIRTWDISGREVFGKTASKASSPMKAIDKIIVW